MLESHFNVYRVRRCLAYSSVTSFLILAKQGAATPFDETNIQAKQIQVKENKDIIISSMDIESVKVTENLLEEQLELVCDIETGVN